MDELYEIRVRGALDDVGRARLADAVRSFEATETVMHVRIADEAELRGILAELHELDCELLAARRVAPRRPARPRSSPSPGEAGSPGRA